ncbi:hypothetical protein KSP35_17550 [Aquihabitans sp. G128]|uniref:phospholipase D family protein n=1 Tax=Aquihabitans sp. G128 TaxID=2849779 RepID=UPI001C21D0CB|nr:phospholipase D-like domain-containing protein [Aquihabitans sp. G128]QXC60144.1 hypothetical protein KSP35_17550 [Aquihabitans sp. G128]
MPERRSTNDPSDWFLDVDERGNRWTQIDRRRQDGCAWTSGNDVAVHRDGRSYFERLHQVLAQVPAAGHVWLADWEGHADERLDGPDTEVGAVLGALADRGVAVRGLLWRSHPRQAHFDEQDNMHLAREVNDRGACLALDERVRRGGSHHQKLVLVGLGAPSGAAEVAFVGGIDLCHGRHDDHDHGGDPQATDELDTAYGDRPPWHDVQLEVRGPAADDLGWTFRERWNDPGRLDHRNPVRAVQRRLLRQPARLDPLPAPPAQRTGTGPCHVQVLRTYPARRPRYAFAPDGERSLARAHLKALGRARRLVVVEDQYLWSETGAKALAEALSTHPTLQVVLIVPRHPDDDGAVTGWANRFARHRVLQRLRAAGGDRVAAYDLVNRAGAPIYVHAKVCIIDDVWMEVGSDNLNRRSWTHDSEVGAAVLDERLDERQPTDPAGLGDGARVLARQTRLDLWTEHLGRAPGDDADLVDPAEGFAVLARHAAALSRWEAAGGVGERPAGHLALHHTEPIPLWQRPAALLAYRTTLDPDGRLAGDRRAGRF